MNTKEILGFTPNCKTMDILGWDDETMYAFIYAEHYKYTTDWDACLQLWSVTVDD